MATTQPAAGDEPLSATQVNRMDELLGDLSTLMALGLLWMVWCGISEINGPMINYPLHELWPMILALNVFLFVGTVAVYWRA